jgi:hypothetical protein
MFIYIFLLEQEKASKAKAVKDKAYQEAMRSQQRQEEFNGFRKQPARAPPQGKLTPLLLSYIDYEYT